tara:strand:+ start:429 stop:1385 length:957 start_codon:yes stop_codon:yes gene_type:complete
MTNKSKIMIIGKNLVSIITVIKKHWPEHIPFLNKSLNQLSEDALNNADSSAEIILKVYSQRIDEIVINYKKTCKVMLEEELFFRRNKEYRFKTLQEVDNYFKDKDNFHKVYYDGLLLSQIIWANHAESNFYLQKVCNNLSPNSLLEIGCGHGLLINQLAKSLSKTNCSAWDINQEAVLNTSKISQIMGLENKVNVSINDFCNYENEKCCSKKFEVIVLFEILEHIENPLKALLQIRNILEKNGKLIVSIPINSPAPDHIVLFEDDKQIDKLALDSQLFVEKKVLIPQTGYDINKAIQKKATITYFGLWSLRNYEQGKS